MINFPSIFYLKNIYKLAQIIHLVLFSCLNIYICENILTYYHKTIILLVNLNFKTIINLNLGKKSILSRHNLIMEGVFDPYSK